MLLAQWPASAHWILSSCTSRHIALHQSHCGVAQQKLQHGRLHSYSAKSAATVPHAAKKQQGQPPIPATRSQLQPDPTADDLDLLAAQSSLVLSHSSSPVGASITPTHNPVHAAAVTAAKPAGRRQQIATAPGWFAAAELGSGPGQSRFTAADKLQLTEAEAKDIAKRLRKPRKPQPRLPVLRIFRYGIDDLSLYKAIDSAGLEGRVVVVDVADFADAVVTTARKRTGRNVNQAVAKRIAAGAGVPCVVLKAVSAQRLLESLGPLLNISAAERASSGMQQAEQSTQQQEASDSVAQSAAAPLHSDGPKLLQLEGSETDGSAELLRLLWGPSAAASGPQPGTSSLRSTASSVSSTAAHYEAETYPRWHAWQASQSAATQELLCAYVRDTDVEDSREYMLHPNPNARAGERHKLFKPLRHSSKIRRKRLNKHLAERQADW